MLSSTLTETWVLLPEEGCTRDAPPEALDLLPDAEQAERTAYPRTKVNKLVAFGVSLDMAIKHAISRKKYWRMSHTPAVRYAMFNEWLEQQGLLSLKQLWYELASLRGTGR